MDNLRLYKDEVIAILIADYLALLKDEFEVLNLKTLEQSLIKSLLTKDEAIIKCNDEDFNEMSELLIKKYKENTLFFQKMKDSPFLNINTKNKLDQIYTIVQLKIDKRSKMLKKLRLRREKNKI